MEAGPGKGWSCHTHSVVREPASIFIVKEIQEMLKEAGYKTECTV